MLEQRGEDAEPDPEQAGREGAPAEPAAATRHRPDPEQHGDDADEDRPRDRPSLDRGDGQEGREGAEEDPEVAGGRRDRAGAR